MTQGLNEFILGYTKAWHDGTVRFAEECDPFTPPDLSIGPNSFLVDHEGMNIQCAVRVHETRGAVGVFYSILGTTRDDPQAS